MSFTLPRLGQLCLKAFLAVASFLVLQCPEPPAGRAQAASNYFLKPSDLLRVEVFQEPDLLKEVRIAADGSIALPLIGKVEIGGRTVQEAQELVRELYDRDYLVNPQINLLVLEYSESYVQVLGQVNSPGFVTIRPDKGLSLIEAIAGANGFTRLARTTSVRLKRHAKVTTIDINEILKNPSVKDISLQEDDIIFVDEKVF